VSLELNFASNKYNKYERWAEKRDLQKPRIATGLFDFKAYMDRVSAKEYEKHEPWSCQLPISTIVNAWLEGQEVTYAS
jgi:hypothetical protein